MEEKKSLRTDDVVCDACERKTSRQSAFLENKWMVVGQRWFACSSSCLDVVLRKRSEASDRVRPMSDPVPEPLPQPFLASIPAAPNNEPTREQLAALIESTKLVAFVQVVNIMKPLPNADRETLLNSVAAYFGFADTTILNEAGEDR
jgi:hypothetical protein